ncbi:serine/threonine-protein kinase [Pseudoxanthomonas sp. PXM02]|uniref:serine/threonine-protein kinase n=1 Tax=Pseudoxanthomonas sp. PXM02 TaxID=2769294 RepID=UPI00178555A6|nr:serine/threonine-protein kinase [Pseudoxanthomonas sp. PXM02]MBD9478829.1 serine/threonine protein kinase [Pseudoxanthomonas sp. PXM02]
MNTHAAKLRALSLFEDYVALAPSERAQALERLRAREPDVHLALEAMLIADAQSQLVDHAPPGVLLDDIPAGTASALDLRVGSRIGPWRITAVLASGGMGTVYEAQRDDGQYQQRVALKCIRQELTSPTLIEAFLNERNTLAQLDHAGIAHLLDGGIDAHGVPWFAMRYVEGETIDQWCDHQRSTVRQRIELVLQACEALAFAHHRMVLHQDIKPSNLLVTAEGQLQVVDFGLAATLASDRPLRRIAVSHGYAAPESLSPDRPTMAVDVYSLGAVMYLLLCGRLPHASGRMRLTASAGTHAEPASHLAREATAQMAQARGVRDGRALSRQLRGDLDAILTRCCAPDPARRYASAAELRDELQRWLRIQPVAAREGAPGYRALTFVRRHRLACGLVALLVASLGAGGVAAHLQSRQTAKEAESYAALSTIFEHTLGNATLSGLGRQSFSSKALLEQTEARMRTLPLQEHPGVLARGLLILARNYAVIGDYRQAKALTDEAALLPGTDGDTALEVQATLAAMQTLAGEPGTALTTAQAALATMDDEPAAATSRVRLQLLTQVAEAQWNLAQHDEAMRTLDRTLGLAAAQVNSEPSDVVALLTLRGQWRMRLQDFKPADTDLRHALGMALSVYPLQAADAERALATSLLAQERFDEALPFAVAQWQHTVQFLGANHPKTGSALIALGNARCLAGDLPGCREAIEQGTALIRTAYGEDHPAYGSALLAQAALLRYENSQWNWDDLAALTRRGLAILERHYPPGNDVLLLARANFANNLTVSPRDAPEWISRMREARDILEDVIAISERQKLPPPPLAKVQLARFLVDSPSVEDDARAELLLKQNATFLAAHYPPAHSHLDNNRIILANLLVELGKPEEADPLLAMVEAQNRPRLPKPKAHILVNAALMIRATIAADRGDRKRAKEILEEALAVTSKDYPPEHRLVVSIKRAMENLRTKGDVRD